MTHTLFISDLHLDPARPHHLQGLEQLLQQEAGRADALYVLGDLFESWIGDDDDAPFNLQAMAAFRHFSDRGSRLFFMHGNRDFLLGEAFARATGGTLLEEGTRVDLYGTPALLMHGDSLCTLDQKYMAFRAMVRQPAWQQDMLSKPLEQRRMIAQMLRMQSQQNNANKADNIMDVTPEEVVQALVSHRVQHLIHGHTHRPAVHALTLPDGTAATRWVLGDWNQSGWKLVVTPDRWDLQEFPLPH